MKAVSEGADGLTSRTRNLVFGSIARTPARWIAGAILVGIVVAFLAPLWMTHPEQDACSFGPVSNDQYRRLLAEAKRKQATAWPKLIHDDYQASIQLNARIDDLSRDLITVYERIAAMHAVLRALGAEYRAPRSRQKDAFEEAVRTGGIAGFGYHIDINRLGFLALIWRRGLLIGGLSAGGKEVASPTDPRRYERGAVSVAALFPKLLETYQYIPRTETGEACPPVPTPEQAERFTQADK